MKEFDGTPEYPTMEPIEDGLLVWKYRDDIIWFTIGKEDFARFKKEFDAMTPEQRKDKGYHYYSNADMLWAIRHDYAMMKVAEMEDGK